MIARVAFLALLVGCAAEDLPAHPDATGGQAGGPQGGVSGSAGQGGSASGTGGMLTSGTSGTGTGGAVTGGTGNGGTAGVAGTGGSLAGSSGSSSGGAAAGGASAGSGSGGLGASGSAGSGAVAGTGGTGGKAGGGAGGTSGRAGAGNAGGAGPVSPSAGCAKMNPRPANGTVTVANDHIYTFPESYDGRTPMPLMLGFHANGNPINQIQTLTNNSELATAFVRAFPKSAGAGWVYNTDITRIRAMWTDLLENYCVDTNRVFGTGHSSGAQMVVQMLCQGERRFRGVAPVAASKYCEAAALGSVAVLYIQGQMDAQRGNGNGADVVQVFRTANACQSTSVPKTDVQMCRSSLDNAQVTAGCITYDGCSKPTLWCSHNDNSYNTTDGRQHGWPCFATSTMAAFFQGLR